jgi:hypothetical protein
MPGTKRKSRPKRARVSEATTFILAMKNCHLTNSGLAYSLRTKICQFCAIQIQQPIPATIDDLACANHGEQAREHQQQARRKTSDRIDAKRSQLQKSNEIQRDAHLNRITVGVNQTSGLPLDIADIIAGYATQVCLCNSTRVETLTYEPFRDAVVCYRCKSAVGIEPFRLCAQKCCTLYWSISNVSSGIVSVFMEDSECSCCGTRNDSDMTFRVISTV